ncbi:MAG: hypothetical protein EOM12_09760 [Verrucomicrobiae bacterium]|nr:hypothetical protein [Verrucomicrobiae bacterium]
MLKFITTWDWRLSTIGTMSSAFFAQMQAGLGCMALLLSIISAIATILFTITKLLDWYGGRDNKNEE